MKVVILVTGFVPNVLGGTEIATYYIAKHLAQRGYDINVITQHERGMPEKSILDDFSVHRCRVIKKKFLWFATYSLRVIFKIAKLKPDLIHVKGISLALTALITKRIFNQSYIIWAQGMDVYSPSRFARLFYNSILSNASGVIAQTNDEKRAIQEICNINVDVIPNGIDLERFNIITREEARNKLGMSPEERIILSVGSLRKVKGTKYLVEAMKTVTENYTGVTLTLIGDGKERGDLEKLTKILNLKDVINFRGKLENDNVLEYMAAADIFVLPSLSEGFPLVILEAMASGLPIITTNVRGLPEIVKDNENGFIVETKNPSDIAEKILKLLKHDEVRARIALTNKHKATNYVWDHILDRLENIYQRVVTHGLASNQLHEN